jgi:hypothetical protein
MRLLCKIIGATLAFMRINFALFRILIDEKPNVNNNSEDLGIDGKVILK